MAAGGVTPGGRLARLAGSISNSQSGLGCATAGSAYPVIKSIVSITRVARNAVSSRWVLIYHAFGRLSLEAHLEHALRGFPV